MTPLGNPLPREIAPDLFWLGDCLMLPFRGMALHAKCSVYFIRGENASMLVETGMPVDTPAIVAQIDELLQDSPPLKYIWATHQETPHAGGMGRLLARYPEARFTGDLHDYHLIFPQLVDRFESLPMGGSIDLGGTEFVAVEAVVRDLHTTQWGFDTKRRALFPGDGFAYAHYHNDGQCGLVAEEVDELDLVDMTKLFSEGSLTWSRFSDMEPYARRLEEFVANLDVAVVGPTHGLPILDVPAILPKILNGFMLAHGPVAEPA